MYSAVASTANYMSRRKISRKKAARKHAKKALLVNPIHFLGGEQININVSGSKFRINDTYLQQYPMTLLGSKEREYFWDEAANEYFFDRDPHIFRFIYKFYKSGILHFSDEDCYDAFLDEMEFFRISTDLIAACCSEDYFRQMYRKTPKEPEATAIPNAVTLREKIWEFCEEPASSFTAKIFYYIGCLIIFISVTLNTVETINCDGKLKCGEVHEEIFFVLDSICVLFFSMEYAIRLYSTPSRWKYFKSAMSIVDLAAILPYYVDLVLSIVAEGESNPTAMNILVTLRTLRIFRIFKLARHSKRLRQLSSAIAKSTNELGFIVFMYSIVIILFASILYYAERVDKNTPFFNIPEAMWYTVVTTTTLGYGDVVPETIQGKMIGSLCCLMGVMVIALPVPIIQMKNGSVTTARPERKSSIVSAQPDAKNEDKT